MLSVQGGSLETLGHATVAECLGQAWRWCGQARELLVLKVAASTRALPVLQPHQPPARPRPGQSSNGISAQPPRVPDGSSPCIPPSLFITRYLPGV